MHPVHVSRRFKLNQGQCLNSAKRVNSLHLTETQKREKKEKNEDERKELGEVEIQKK